MDEQTQKRAERISNAFGLHPRMRAEEAGRWVIVLAVGKLDAQLFDEERSTMFFACKSDVYPDPNDAMNLGLLREVVQVDFDSPTLYARTIVLGHDQKWRIDGEPKWYGYLAQRGATNTGIDNEPLIGDTESDAWCVAKELAGKDAR